MKAAVSIRNVTKYYKNKDDTDLILALDKVNLEIEKGSIFGLLGPNGAGKSTLISSLIGLVQKSEGKIYVWGYDLDESVKAVKHHIGIVPQELFYDPFFTPQEILEYQAGYFGVPKDKRRTDELLKAVDLYEKKDAYARTLSGGMKRRLMVAKAMVHSPPVLVLDEPTAGVDIELRQNLWEYVRELNRQGTTIIFTTHYLEEAEALCDKIAILNHGKVIICEEKQKLLAQIDQKKIIFKLDIPVSDVPERLKAFNALMLDPFSLQISYAPSMYSAAVIIETVKEAGILYSDLITEQGSLEDVFMNLTHQDQDQTQK